MRMRGVTKPILVLNPRIESFDKILHFRLEPTIYKLDMLTKINALLEILTNQDHNNNINNNNNNSNNNNNNNNNSNNNNYDHGVDIHIELETGFHRHGFDSDKLGELTDALLRTSSMLRVKGKLFKTFIQSFISIEAYLI